MTIKRLDIYSLVVAIALSYLVGCDDNTAEILDEIVKPKDSISVVEPIDIEVSRTLTDKTLYAKGDAVKLKEFTIKNTSVQDVKIDSIWVEVGTASTNGATMAVKIKLSGDFDLDAGEALVISDDEVIIDTGDLQNRSYLVSLRMGLSAQDTAKLLEQQTSDYLTFFRISEDQQRLVHDISTEDYDGLPVFKLSGGLSAEYAVQKSAASLARGVSHSWKNINPPLLSSPDFLQRSLDQAVNFYNEVFGVGKKFKTVIISTGITPISYISRTMDAPVLPLHFLTGANTTKEVQTILDYTLEQGVPAYATFGHDYSLSTSKGVAWIKLLDLPEAYQKFLIDHQVEEIIFFGATSSGGGEKAARQVKNGIGHLEPGSIYLMYFAGNLAESFLTQVIADFNSNNLGPKINISDWESGIIGQQITAMAAKARANATVNNAVLITSPVDDIHLWNLATYSMLKFFNSNHITPQGVSLNPYLAGHPLYESYTGHIPFTYFNGIPGSFHVPRVNGMLADALDVYFPDVSLLSLPFVANTGTSSEFFSGLVDEGYGVSTLANDDLWDLSDGLNTPSELRAEELLNKIGPAALKVWADNLTYLTIADMKEIAVSFPEISVTDK